LPRLPAIWAVATANAFSPRSRPAVAVKDGSAVAAADASPPVTISGISDPRWTEAAVGGGGEPGATAVFPADSRPMTTWGTSVARPTPAVTQRQPTWLVTASAAPATKAAVGIAACTAPNPKAWRRGRVSPSSSRFDVGWDSALAAPT